MGERTWSQQGTWFCRFFSNCLGNKEDLKLIGDMFARNCSNCSKVSLQKQNSHAIKKNCWKCYKHFFKINSLVDFWQKCTEIFTFHLIIDSWLVTTKGKVTKWWCHLLQHGRFCDWAARLRQGFLFWGANSLKRQHWIVGRKKKKEKNENILSQILIWRRGKKHLPNEFQLKM